MVKDTVDKWTRLIITGTDGNEEPTEEDLVISLWLISLTLFRGAERRSMFHLMNIDKEYAIDEGNNLK